MCHLTQPAGRLVLAVGMCVSYDLKQKEKRSERKSKRQRPDKSARKWMRYCKHFRASFDGPRFKLALPAKGSRYWNQFSSTLPRYASQMKEQMYSRSKQVA
jgi:hypothetical protein